MGLSGSSRLSHGSSQILIFAPFPTTQPSFFRRRSLPTRILCHPWEAALGEVQLKRFPSGQYLLKRVLPSSPYGFSRRRTLIFAKKASLKSWISLTPRPPLHFGRVNFSQEIQAIFLFPFPRPTRSALAQIESACKEILAAQSMSWRAMESG